MTKDIKLSNKQAKILMEELQNALCAGFIEHPNVINKEEREHLTKLDNLSDEADILINKNASGGIIISSDGSIDFLGKFDSNMKYSKQYKANYEVSKKEFEYAINEVRNALEDGSINYKEAQKIERLDEILKDIAIVITDDKKGAVLANTYGDTYKLKFINKGKCQ